MHPPKAQAPMQPPPEPMHQDPNGSFSGNCGVQAPLHFPKTQVSGSEPLPPHLRTAPPWGRGSWPLPWRLGHCSAAFGCWGAAPPGARPATGGKRRERARLLGPASFPSPPPTPGRWGRQFACAVATRGGCCGGAGMEGVGGYARPASWRAGAELTGQRTGAKCPAACGAYGGWSFPEPRAAHLRGVWGDQSPPRGPAGPARLPRPVGPPGGPPAPSSDSSCPGRAGLRVGWQGRPLNSAPLHPRCPLTSNAPRPSCPSW